jgi:hypothetical protein
MLLSTSRETWHGLQCTSLLLHNSKSTLHDIWGEECRKLNIPYFPWSGRPQRRQNSGRRASKISCLAWIAGVHEINNLALAEVELLVPLGGTGNEETTANAWLRILYHVQSPAHQQPQKVNLMSKSHIASTLWYVYPCRRVRGLVTCQS